MNKRGKWLWEASKFFMGVSFGLLLVIPISLWIPSRPQEKPVDLIASTYEHHSLCPGDEVDPYSITWHIRGPSVLLVTISHLRAPQGDTAEPGRLGTAFVTNIPTERTITEKGVSFVVPDLPPGKYERVIGISTLSENSEPEFLALPYTVRDDCPN